MPGVVAKIMLPDVHNRSPLPPSTRDMPEILSPRARDVVAFDGRNKRRSRRSPAQIRSACAIKMSPKMIARAVGLRKNRRPSR